jgi:hypothetical protein
MKTKIHFFIISRSLLLRVGNVSDKSCRENQNTHFVLSEFPPPENRAVNEIMWKNIVDPDRPQMLIWRMRVACWVRKNTETLTRYVIFLALPLQHCLHDCASMLRYTYSACLVLTYHHIRET